MKSNTYHNTTFQDLTFVLGQIDKCKNQEEQVMVFMNKDKKLTASDVWGYIGHETAPLTSIRRALSNLTHEGKLYKTTTTKIGLYGKPEHYYELFDLDKLF